MDYLMPFFDMFLLMINFILKIDVYLLTFAEQYGSYLYGILFLIVFCETGLIVTPILPGDSLLFAAGAICSRGILDPFLTIGVTIVAAFLGDLVNYSGGRFFGVKLFKDNSRFLKKSYIDKTELFYQKYGAKAIVFCRFVPIVRTFAPFIAGFGKMNYGTFIFYNIFGAVLWAPTFVLAGYFFGNIPVVREMFTLTIFGIIGVSLIPLLVEFIRGYRKRQLS